MRRSPVLPVVFLLVAVLLPGLAHAWSNAPLATLVLGQSNFTGNASVTTQNGMSFALGVAVDPTSGKVFVADSANNRILRFASLAGLSTGVNAEAVLGQSVFSSSTAATTQSGMRGPWNLTVDSGGHLWVADSQNSRVLRFDNAASKADGANADGVLGQSNFTDNFSVTSQSGMNWPTSVATDSSGRLWVAERFNRRVLRFDNAASKANGANADGVLGQPDFTSKTMATTQNGMIDPYSVAVDSTGTLWVADNSNRRVLRFDNAASKADGANADGVLGQANFTSNASAITQSGMSDPSGLAIDSIGRLWVADSQNNRVLRFDNAASKADGANADGVLGQSNFTSNTAARTQSGMSNPFGLATDSAGNVWVADGENSRVLLFQDATEVTITRAGSSPTSAASVAFTVTFSSPVTGVSASNFTLTAGGTISGASITNVTGSGTVWTVTAATGSGSGMLRLDMSNAAGVQDSNGNSVTNVPYTSGESYSKVLPTDVATSLTYQRAASGSVTFTLIVSNLGPAAAGSTTVSAVFPTLANGGTWSWTCSASNGATCAASGTGNLSASLTSFPSGSSVTYIISSTTSAAGTWTTTATTSVPATVIDTTPGNNSATVRSSMSVLPLIWG